MTAKELLARYKAGELLFKNADLRGVDLSYQNLRRICLYGADLTGAKLVNTNLQGADLRYARFDGADVHYANLDDSIRGGGQQRGRTCGASFPRGGEDERVPRVQGGEGEAERKDERDASPGRVEGGRAGGARGHFL